MSWMPSSTCRMKRKKWAETPLLISLKECRQENQCPKAGGSFSVAPERYGVQRLSSGNNVHSLRWNGTLVDTIPFLNVNTPLIRRAVWLWSRWCHHFCGTNSGIITVITPILYLACTSSKKSRNGLIIERYGDSSTMSGTPIPNSSHLSCILLVSSGSRHT